MNSNLAELLENQSSGLLWVSRNLDIRFANQRAREHLGIAHTAKVVDAELARAVAETIGGGGPRNISLLLATSSQGTATRFPVQCRVIRGLTREDAFVLMRDPQAVDPIEALDDLMSIIRSDIKDPLQQVQQALLLARDDDSDRHTVGALLDNVEQLADAVKSLFDLATVWSTGSLRVTDRIEVLALLRKAWADVQPLAQQRGISVRFRSPLNEQDLAPVYGSEIWLQRVLVECLDSAIRANRGGTTLEIVHRQVGPRALIVFRDCGAFASRHVPVDAVELSDTNPPRGTPRPAAPWVARERIGLKLSQHVLALHGGHLRDEDEDGLRNFLIDIPTGAPHQNANHQVDIAQAQQYAQDLASLMARARARPGATT